MPGLIQVADYQSRVIAGEISSQPVDLRDPDGAAAYGRHNLHFPSVCAGQEQFYRIGVRLTQIDAGHAVLHAVFFSVAEAVRNPGIVHRKAQESGNQCLVRTVSFAGGEKRTVEIDIRVLYRRA